MPQPGLTVVASKTRRPFSYNLEAFFNKSVNQDSDNFRNYILSQICVLKHSIMTLGSLQKIIKIMKK